MMKFCVTFLAILGLFGKTVLGGFNENNYYVSTNAAVWTHAVEDCQRSFHPESHLLSIESEEEMKFINEYLEKFGIGVSYWTSGRADPSKNSGFRWGANEKGVPAVAPWFNWAPGHPPSHSSAVQRIAISHRSVDDSDFEIYSKSLPRRFICELTDKNTTIPVPCYETNDVFIVLDSSGSISPSDYDIAKNFIAKLVRVFAVHDKNRVGMSTYSNAVNPVFPLEFPVDPASLESKVLSAPHSRGSTGTHLALDDAVAATVPLRRDGVPQSVVVLTDGMSDQPPATIVAAKKALAQDLRMFAVGIGRYDKAELGEISGHRDDRVFTVDQFNELVQVLRPLSQRICPDYE